MEFGVGTYNLQRQSSDEMVQAVFDLQEDFSQGILCLQEVSRRMSEKLLGCFPQAINHGENMIIYTENFKLKSTTHFDILGKDKPFLSGTFASDDHEFTVFTGKLQHGPLNEHKRLYMLRMLLGQMTGTPGICGLDENFVFQEEYYDMVSLLDLHHFGATSHPEGTHVLSRLEPKNFIYWFLRLYGRLSGKRSELDKILYSNDFQLINSQVIQDKTLSDHEPVIAQLRFKE